MASPAEDVATFLASTPAHGLTVGVNLFCGPVRAASLPEDAVRVPHAAVFVEVDDSGEVQRYQGVRRADRALTVRVTVRGAPHDDKATMDRAEVLRKALEYDAPAGYYDCEPQDAFPEFMERDDAGCPEWEFVVELRWVG